MGKSRAIYDTMPQDYVIVSYIIEPLEKVLFKISYVKAGVPEVTMAIDTSNSEVNKVAKLSPRIFKVAEIREEKKLGDRSITVRIEKRNNCPGGYNLEEQPWTGRASRNWRHARTVHFIAAGVVLPLRERCASSNSLR
ncbi:hypothetical protein GJ496_000742 [Pomphorhynchus laevis]|nr:hypothetical protein GJ496_000742 [Pomphorhynchus laevis]